MKRVVGRWRKANNGFIVIKAFSSFPDKAEIARRMLPLYLPL